MCKKRYKAPRCIDPEGHSLARTEPPFWFECESCFERFGLVSETVAKAAGIEFVRMNQ